MYLLRVFPPTKTSFQESICVHHPRNKSQIVFLAPLLLAIRFRRPKPASLQRARDEIERKKQRGREKAEGKEKTARGFLLLRLRELLQLRRRRLSLSIAPWLPTELEELEEPPTAGHAHFSSSLSLSLVVVVVSYEAKKTPLNLPNFRIALL
ncbi:unnamed protein product [Caenorhabditis auriculariae]|uniref:Uncharacterized protein n=1 Tax=Caenorhabditis auriculariae TaxID=2777116 RepID=A0A8S1H8B1_9PELO|nr:unnamed protein product [Caenorhabditis auriculariae]